MQHYTTPKNEGAFYSTTSYHPPQFFFKIAEPQLKRYLILSNNEPKKNTSFKKPGDRLFCSTCKKLTVNQNSIFIAEPTTAKPTANEHGHYDKNTRTN